LWNGSGWQLAKVLTAPSASPPANTNTPFDVFAYLSSGAPAIECLAWTNDITRATALTRLNGVLVKSGDPTRRYIGTGRTTGTSGQCANSVTRRLLWNYYNRTRMIVYKRETSSETLVASGNTGFFATPPDIIVGDLDWVGVFAIGLKTSTASIERSIFWKSTYPEARSSSPGTLVLTCHQPTVKDDGGISSGSSSYYHSVGPNLQNHDGSTSLSYTDRWVSGYLEG
jgi:hypothetical protein